MAIVLLTGGVTEYYCYHPTDCNAGPQGNRLFNIRSGNAAGPVTRQFQYDDSGRVLSKADGAGNTIYSLAYNGKGRAYQINQTSAQYDPNDYRIRKDDKLYHLEAEHHEATYNAGGELVDKYLRGVVIDELVNAYHYESGDESDWTNYTFHHDHLNSVTGLTGHNGSVEETTQYGAFGETLSQTVAGAGNDLLYTGRELDRANQLYYYRARYYDPEIGRFVSEDPLGFDAGINFYAYVANNPMNLNDPSGLRCVGRPGAPASACSTPIRYNPRWGDVADASLGMVAGAAGAFVGATGMVGSAALIAAPEPATTVAGVGAMSVSSTLLANSSGNFVLNLQNFGSALVGNAPSVPGSLAEGVADIVAPGSRDAQLLAHGFNLSLDLASGLMPVGFIATNVDSALGGRRMANILELSDYGAAIPNNPLFTSTPAYGTSLTSIALETLQWSDFGQTSMSIYDLVQDDISAGGGYVVYPSRINNNMVKGVYSK